MTLRSGLLGAFFCVFAGGAMAQGCPPDDGETIDDVEAINQLIIDADYEGLAAKFRDAGIGDPTSVTNTLSSTFPNGFSECTTLVQRIEAGTAAQSVVVFTGGVSTLYVYVRSALINDQFYVINLYLNTDEAKVFERVF